MCGSVTKLIRAHIIPRALYKPILKESDYALEATNRPEYYNRKLPVGIYDAKILCETCERLFSPFDCYANELLLEHDWSTATGFPKDKPQALLLKNHDYHNLKLFFMSVVWRASVSSQPFFGRVEVGPHEERLREHIRNNDSGGPQDFGALIAKFDGPTRGALDLDPKQMWLNPDRAKFDDVNCVRLWLADFCVYVKVDSRPYNDLATTFCMKDGEPLIVILREFASSKELSVIRKMAQQQAAGA
jgi:hypothetical protein